MQRDIGVDIAKALGIILMVLGHAGMPYSSVIFCFHMALFFVLSGWCFSDKYLENYKTVFLFTWNKIKGLYIPFVLFNGLTVVLRNWFVKINVYTDNNAFLEQAEYGGNGYGIMPLLSGDELKAYLVNVFKFAGESQLGGATWFLRVMFGVTLLWCVVNYILKSVCAFSDRARLVVNMVLSMFLIALTWGWMKSSTHFYLQFETVASAYVMFCVGYYLKKVYPIFTIRQNLVIGIVAFFILRYCDKICFNNGWDSNVNIFDNPIMYLVSSFSGFIMIFSVAHILKEFKGSKVLVIIGQHTLGVLLWHFLSFKIVTFLQCLIYDLPFYRVASFPVYNSTGLWWAIYSVIGVVVPVLITIIYEFIKNQCKIITQRKI